MRLSAFKSPLFYPSSYDKIDETEEALKNMKKIAEVEKAEMSSS
jgi:hypothetical protein